MTEDLRRESMGPCTPLWLPNALALAHLSAGGNLQVVARQLDAAAPKADDVGAANWTAWKCTALACQEDAANRTYLPLTPILNAVGWYQPVPAAPLSLTQAGTWSRWTNVTGLVTGVTRYGDELKLLSSQSEIVPSSLRDCLEWVWNGTAFLHPDLELPSAGTHCVFWNQVSLILAQNRWGPYAKKPAVYVHVQSESK